MTVTTIKTKAEQQLAAQFEAAAPMLPGAGWVAAARRAAMGRFVALGLPHRKLEAWKYTDLRVRLAQALPPAAAKPATLDAKLLATVLGPGLAKLPAAKLVFVDGVFNAEASGPTPELNDSWSFVALADALADPEFAWMAASFANLPEAPDDALLSLNSAFATDGVVLRVFDGAAPAHPIHLVFVSTTASASTSTRNLIRIGTDAVATILESHVAIDGAARQTNAVTQVHLLAGATLHHLKLTAEGAGATHLGATLARLEADTSYHSFQMTEGAATARHQVFVTFAGENASFNFNATTLGRGKSHIDTTMVIDHAVPRCTSRENIRAVLADEARGVFQGKVIVRPDAQKSDGKQMAKALLLSPDAEFDSKPELEIYADDVVCGHGSTVAEMDEDHVFYLMARGIPEVLARAMLTEAFAAEVIDAIRHDGIRDAMRARLVAWLAAG